jgi:hypothetical protein
MVRADDGQRCSLRSELFGRLNDRERGSNVRGEEQLLQGKTPNLAEEGFTRFRSGGVTYELQVCRRLIARRLRSRWRELMNRRSGVFGWSEADGNESRRSERQRRRQHTQTDADPTPLRPHIPRPSLSRVPSGSPNGERGPHVAGWQPLLPLAPCFLRYDVHVHPSPEILRTPEPHSA